MPNLPAYVPVGLEVSASGSLADLKAGLLHVVSKKYFLCQAREEKICRHEIKLSPEEKQCANAVVRLCWVPLISVNINESVVKKSVFSTFELFRHGP